MAPHRRAEHDSAISRLGDQRRALLTRAVNVLAADREVPITAQAEALRETTGLLATSLEELKVAEERLRTQNAELRHAREAIESASRHFRRLFDDAPLPYVVTDVVGIIRHVNRASATLLRRPAALLEQKPLLELIPLEQRSAFRDALRRVELVDEAHDWRARLLRHGEAAIDVAIDVRLSRGAIDGDDVICWLLRPVNGSVGTA